MTSVLSVLFALNFIGKSVAPFEPSPSLPPLYDQADFNQDGTIEHSEVLQCIEEFFYGHNRYSEEEIYQLIDYFLDQAK